ncbi:GNAT family N-acetyltransferase [Phreatobacter aquaticus]|uniref:GNAT family N-acetyltransferase n=1 Tax=Phreatobacter aquaticus TaxID=2570229 RepID=A0A4D7QEZ3_9HYPH|nr:GNAT family N-acetyltransferase [Phreatobacter aquaticus]QCK86510.1 GNAT family N-acetyltransferase [Phreatobacter aquaticus]
MIVIALERADSAEARALIAAADAFAATLYPPEQRHGSLVDRLLADDIRFLVARHEGRAVGCVALAIAPPQGEVKRLFVHSTARGLGAGRALMEALEAVARSECITLVQLETGPRNAAALQLYAAMGYKPCAAFGSYRPSPGSVFMEKTLFSE